MFIINSNTLKDVIGQLVKSARKAGLGDKTIYIRTLAEKGLVSFYYTGMEISVQKEVPIKINEHLEVATSINELSIKVSALPEAIEVKVEKCISESISYMNFSWGKRDKLKVEILPETSPMVEVPPFQTSVKWKPGSLHNMIKYLSPFTLPDNSPQSSKIPNAHGPNISKDDTGRVIIRATDAIKGVRVHSKSMQWFDESLSIHTKSLLGVADVIPDDAEIQVGLSDNVVIFQAGHTTAVCRTLIGTFPNIDDMFKKNRKGKIIIDRLELIKACKRVKLLAPTAAILQMRVIENKVSLVVPGVLEQVLPAIFDGTIPTFAVGAIHMEISASLFEMQKDSDELTIHVDSFDSAISVSCDDKEDISVFCLPHLSQYAREANKAQESESTTVTV